MAIQLSRIDHHKVLGVSPAASPAEIESAHASLSAQLRDQPWQFERARAVDRAYQTLTGTRPVRTPVPDGGGSSIIGRNSTEEEAVHASPAPDDYRGNEQPSPPPSESEGAYYNAEPHNNSEPQYGANPDYGTGARYEPASRYDDEPPVGAGSNREDFNRRDLAREDDGDDERSGRRAFYVIGALALAGIVGVVAFPMVQTDEQSSQEQAATPGAGDGSQTGPEAPTGPSTIASTNQLEGDSSATGALTQALPSENASGTPQELGDVEPPQLALNDVPDDFEAGASLTAPADRREEEASARAAEVEPPPARREERAPARSVTPEPSPPVERAEPRPTPPAPTPRAVPAQSRAARAVWVRGGLIDSDNRGGQFNGAVSVRLNVSPTGRASSCQIARSSGNPALDATTCRLLVSRLEFVPARNAAGNPIATEVTSTHVWARSSRNR